ncbi:MaoC family dehydratase N-terminal domain-containing protein [Palleronia sp. LCG004]|uniref:FAS1-like dehydratase domain-containing protein n=1 Tax=Palleronia sp. LCG004 TaxID=3079304 RepID=UPI002943D83E|nr:MaoC family dehydratase N-terminal domain-containing protein [Palleronia sp. LCG004]WOI57821.1 MaoC family dehydratase N-terminal domain-containing protein [Palleronia sp. LCG004]
MDGTENAWIGKSRSATDRVTARLVAEYHAVLGTLRGPGEIAAGFHWCLAPDIAAREHLGRDGHPRPGLVLPKLPLPRRMWAGGSVDHHAPFAIGDEVERRSTVSDIVFKKGRSGRLGFVTVEHVHSVGGEIRVRERQDIVYREDPAPDASPRPPEPGEEWEPRAAWSVVPDATTLFRYSAATFNGHRIHYDAPYAREVERYGGLVVHGPLQASWMQNLAGEVLGRIPARFEYRGVAPLVAGYPVRVEARAGEDGALELRVRREEDGVVTMLGRASG